MVQQFLGVWACVLLVLTYTRCTD